MKLFFVCGAQKSGTTWVQRLLDAHPEVVCSGEGHFVERLAAPMLQMRETYNKQMQMVAERVYENKPYYRPLSSEDVLAVCRTLILHQMEQRRTSDTLALGDKTPRYFESLKALKALFPQAVYINVVRDPRDVVVSALHHRRRIGMADALDPSSAEYQKTVNIVAEAWRTTLEKVAAFAAENPSSLLELRYEDLVAEPLETARGAFRFLGVRVDDDLVRAALDASSFETLTGRPAGEESQTSFLRKGIAGDWQGVLDQRSVAMIQETCGPAMIGKGYAV